MNYNEDTPSFSIRDNIQRFGLTQRRSLGQNFLLDRSLLRHIIGLAGDLTGRQVVEVGPGPGGLTFALLETPVDYVVAIEKDRRAVPLLNELAQHFQGRLSVVPEDARRLDLTQLVAAPRQIVANLPYNVATHLLMKWLMQGNAWEQMTLMFQKEVAQRICAVPSTPSYGRLSIISQWIAHCSVRLIIPPTAFTPPPKVESAVVTLIPRPLQPTTELFQCMEKITRLAFGQRRKMLRVAYKPIGGETLLRQVNIDPSRRGETLVVEEFVRLAQYYLNNK